jgi:ubiquinone biosynthesis protein COQ9
MDKEKAARDIIIATLPNVVFDGWSLRALQQGAASAGYKKTDVIRVFPGGAAQAVKAYSAMLDEKMITEMQRYHLTTMKIRERITLAVRKRIEAMEPHKEAARRAVTFSLLPLNVIEGASSLYKTVDAIWHAIGDSSTDFNYYTKRATLAAVYSSTVLFWLDDESAGHQAAWDFLDRRIENAMAFEKARAKLRGFFENKLSA